MNSPVVIDMHFGALLGAGWLNSDPGGIYATSTTAPVAAGAFEIPVSGNYGFNPGMLLVCKAEDDEWYPFRLVSSSATLLKSDRPLPALLSGAEITNAYSDNAHPNVNGREMIADFALRQLSHPVFGRVRKIEKIFRENTSVWSASGGASFSYSVNNSYIYPASDITGERGGTVTGSVAGGGVTGPWLSPGEAGDYITRVVINSGNRGAGTNNSVQVHVDERSADGVTVTTIASSEVFVGYDALQSIELQFSTEADGRSVRTRVVCVNSGPWSFLVGQNDYYRLSGSPLNLNTGKHVIFGDSWATPGSGLITRLANRLNNANIVAKGVGGNRASQLISRFATDVTPEEPNFVWVMVGTNDFYAGVTPGNFETDIGQLKAMILGIGAVPIFFTPSVGDANYSTPMLFPSRRYLTYVRYLDMAPAPTPIPDTNTTAGWFNSHISELNLSLLPNETRIIYISGKTNKSAVLNFLASDNPYIKIVFGFSSSISGTFSDFVEFDGGIEKRNRWIYKNNNNYEFLCVKANNITGDQVNVSIVSDIAWKNG